MISSYSVYIRSKDGTYRDRLLAISSMSFLETLNDVGSWTIKSTTPDQCPFTAGDGIVVYRNGTYYYSGVLTNIRETYDGFSGLYDWTASGQSDLAFLSWRVAYPDPVTLETDQVSHYEDSGNLAHVIKRLVDKNLGPDAHNTRIMEIIDPVAIGDLGTEVSVSLRFQTLLEVIARLCNEQNFTLRYFWDADRKKLRYQIYDSSDLSSLLVFSTAYNQITDTEFSLNQPKNYIISGGQGEMTERAFAYAWNETSMFDWGRIEFFHDMRSVAPDEIQADADNCMKQNSMENVGWSASINADDTMTRYKYDWNLGDVVGVIVRGRDVIQRVLQVQTEVSYDSEIIKPTVGTINRGQFDVILDRVSRMRSDVNQLQWVMS